jgi:hypothetical protein
MKSNYVQNIENFAEQLSKVKSMWMDQMVYPHLVDLLNKAQSRLRRKIRFLSGNGIWAFYFDGDDKHEYDLSFWLTEAVSQPKSSGENPAITKIRRRFPELIEFCDIVIACQDELDETVGDVYPTVEARTK